MKNIIVYIAFFFLLVIAQACKDELSEVTNTNEPNETALGSEAGLVAFAKGGAYINGVGNYYASVDDQLGPRAGKNLGYLTTLIFGLHESLGDNVFVPWGNQSFRFADNPTDWTLDDNSVVPNPLGQGQPFELRLRNDRAYGAANTFLMEWTQMYFLNNAMNMVLGAVDEAEMEGDVENKRRALRAWAYWWKGYAYSRIGSMYVAGIIADEPKATNADFVTNVEMIAAANANFDKAEAELNAVSDLDAYDQIMSVVIPGYCQSGKGGVPSPDEWIRNMNTMRARNLLVNKRVDEMTADATENGQTFYVSERLIQDYRPGDDRMANNFALMTSPVVNIRARGLNFGTRYYLIDGGNDMSGVITYVHTGEYGVDDIYLAGTYEENALMRAEALIRGGDIPAGTAIIDEVRAYQGAGLPAIGAVTEEQALEELRSERRVGLVFRAVAFYDARRWGVIDDKSQGGGRAGAVVLSFSGTNTVVNTNAFINYNYLSYFDVPTNETEFNNPALGSSPVVGPE
jgi:starch-binding outer membrane protein, SusD/RagB family